MSHPRVPAAAYDAVVLAASAGGVGTVGRILADLPADFPAPIVLVQHLGVKPSVLVEVLQRRSKLPLQWAEHGVRLRPGRVHVAPPSRHLVIGPGGVCLLDGSNPIHSVRPAADVTFISSARTFRRRAMGVILTGYGVDGSAGALAIHAAGGVVLVQDPLTCDAPAMALATIAAAAHDVVVPLEALGATLAELVGDLGAERACLRELAAERFPRHPARAGPAA